MPTLKRYQNERGYYIHARVESSVITYQTSPTARKLFDELGYSHGSSISWTMIKEMEKRGDVYTGGGGVDIENIEDSKIGYSTDQRKVYEMYLNEGLVDTSAIEEIDFTVKELFENSDPSCLAKPSEIKEELASASNRYPLLESVKTFSKSPYSIKDINIYDDSVGYVFSVDNDVKIVCHDTRWTPLSHDFEGIVDYGLEGGTSSIFLISDGWFSEWTMSDGTHSNSDDPSGNHRKAFKADFGLKGSLGFDVLNWTEIARKLFLYLPEYDIRPGRRGHRGLCKMYDLEGKHIWVDAHKTNKSSAKTSGDGVLIVDNEIITIRLPSVDEQGSVFVEVGDIKDGRATGKPVRIRKGEN